MDTDKRFLVQVGMKDLSLPIKAASKVHPDGQSTIANISITARIMDEFEAGWIDKFIQIVHQHRGNIGTKTLRQNIQDYFDVLHATMVKIDFDYPFFIEKLTPVSKEKCLVRYQCTFSAKLPSIEPEKGPRISFKMHIPVITSYPVSRKDKPQQLFGQHSIVTVELISFDDFFPEDVVEIVDRHALLPVYSFLTEEDQDYVINKIHSERKTSVVMTDEINKELNAIQQIEFYSVNCANFGMLHSYSTFIGTEKNLWVPFSITDHYEV